MKPSYLPKAVSDLSKLELYRGNDLQLIYPGSKGDQLRSIYNNELEPNTNQTSEIQSTFSWLV